MPIYPPAEPGEEAFIFNTGIWEAGLYFASCIDRNGKPQRPGHRAEQMPSEGSAPCSRRRKTPNAHQGETQGLKQKVLARLSRGVSAHSGRKNLILAPPSELRS